MQGIKLVTFDATNTLLRFRIPAWQYYSIVAQDYGFTGTQEIIKARLKDSIKIMNNKHPNFGKSDVSWEDWWKEVVKLTFHGQLPSPTNIDRIANKLISEYKTQNCWCVADGSQKMLNFLRKNGMCVGVISNFDPRLNDILQNMSLYHFFDFILTSYDVGYSKPDKKIFNTAIEACKKSVKPSESLHIGDDLEKDYHGARNAGWHALLVGTTNTNKPLPAKNHVYNSIEELAEALEQNKIKL